MKISALVLQETSSTQLWGLSSEERLRRQIREIGGVIWLSRVEPLPSAGGLLLLDGRYLFEIRTLQGLLQHPGSVLFSSVDDKPAAALVEAAQAQEVMAYLAQSGVQKLPEGLQILRPGEIVAYNETLRSAREPLLEPVSTARRPELENLLYGNAYRGITDLVTKFIWPRPARVLVHWCAALRLTPNMVTSSGLLLVLAACYLFLHGHFLSGLAAGWLMTLLDTVDGKLARVTVQSSPFGHLFDHGIDLLHPPFWYIFWGMSLETLTPVLGLDFSAMCWLLVGAYVLGRVAEGLFSLLGDCSIFTWRPFDAWFRLITARRNPCLIILSLSALFQRYDWGFVAVVGWSAWTTGVLMVRLLQGLITRVRRGPLTSWLSEEQVENGPHARSFGVFAGTRSAYTK